MRGDKKCYICFRPHDFSGSTFPMDYPNKMKWCCDCLTFAKKIVKSPIHEVKEHTLRFSSWRRHRFFQLRRIRVIKKLINIG